MDLAQVYALTPPLLALVLVLVTKNIFLSLGSSLVIGAVLMQGPFLGNLWGIVVSVLSDPWNIKILLFIPAIFLAIEILIKMGGLHSLVERLSRGTHGRRQSQFLTFIGGLLLFFDDFANALIMGGSMRPIYDHRRISREKLAFIVDATSAPVTGLIFISTWVGHELGLFQMLSESLSWNREAMHIFVEIVPFRFYCLMMLIFVFLNIFMQRDFGPMLKAERKVALSKEPVPEEHKHHERSESQMGPLILFTLGVLVFLTSGTLVGFWLDGGGPLSLVEFFSITRWKEVIVKVDESADVLLKISLLSAFISLVGLYCFRVKGKRRSIHRFLAEDVFRPSFKTALTPMCILALSWGLKLVLDDLETSKVLVSFFHGISWAHLFPALVFLLASVTAFSTGTSWGTMSIILPTFIPVAFHLDGNVLGPITSLSLASVLDGAIFGDHCSPISDTTIMSSSASQCNHMAHVKTQFPYALWVSAQALVFGYYLASFEAPLWVSLALAALSTALLLRVAGDKIKV